MMALFASAAWIFSARSLDRLGKGIRTGARDAMLSDEATPHTKGKVFGFHRSMDTMGAVIGPGIALAYLYFYPGQYKTLFYIAFIPGILSILCTLFIKEKNAVPKESRIKTRFLDFTKYWKTSPAAYRKLVTGLLLFALFNSSDMFLLLKVKAAGMSDTEAIGSFYIFYNFVYAAFAYPLGKLGDKIGLKKVCFLFRLWCLWWLLRMAFCSSIHPVPYFVSHLRCSLRRLRMASVRRGYQILQIKKTLQQR